MRERPIIFSGPMVQAILAGQKSMTRRVVKPQPIYRTDIKHETCFAANGWWWTRKNGTGIHSQGTEEELKEVFSRSLYWCPHGSPGDRLWLREGWALVPASAYDWREIPHARCGDECVIYRASWERSPGGICWRSPIHMLRRASRLTLEITDVRVERVQEISEEDALAEGCKASVYRYWEGYRRIDGHRVGISVGAGEDGKSPAPEWMECAELETIEHSAREGFEGLWNSLNAKRGFPWSSNSWVWVISFREVKAP